MGGETSGGVRSSSAGRPLVSTHGAPGTIVPMGHRARPSPRRYTARSERDSRFDPRGAAGILVAVAVLLNAGLFAVGVYFELHPRDRHDRWSAAGVAGVALLNSAALTCPPSRAVGARFLVRLRRIAFLANSLLLLVAVLIVGLEALDRLRGSRRCTASRWCCRRC